MSAVLRRFAPKTEEKKPRTHQPLAHKPLLLHNRGMIRQEAQVFDNFQACIPHAKSENSMTKKHYTELGEIAEDRRCDTIGMIETCHKRRIPEGYLWIAACPHGPSFNFYINDAQSIENLRLIGNAMKGSRPILQFDPKFDDGGVFELAKMSLQRLFSVPFQDKHSKPYVDRTMMFTIENGLIYIRHYQIQWGDGENDTDLAEIGPRVVLEPNFVLAGVFSGRKIWKNANFTGPYQEMVKEKRETAQRKNAMRDRQARKEEKKLSYPEIDNDPNHDLFVAQEAPKEEEDEDKE